MQFDVEVVLRERADAVTERILHSGHDAAEWDETDVEAVLKAILLAIERVRDPQSVPRHVALRGFSWIVEPVEGGVAIAIEIPSGAAVAGPFATERARLDGLVSRVIAAAAPSRPVVH